MTQAKLQRVQLSFNGTSDLSTLIVSRQNTNSSVLWAVENTALFIVNVDIFWGQISDSFGDDPSVETTRSEALYLPAGASDYWGADQNPLPSAGQPSTIPAAAWSGVYATNPSTPVVDVDYSGNGNIALLTKWQSLLAVDPVNGPAQITNFIWTDVVANTLVGTDTSNNISVAANEPSLSYDLKYSIPAFLSLAIWLPIFLGAVVVLLTGTLRLSHMRHLLNQTSVGRIVVGDSALTTVNGPGALAETGGRGTSHLGTSHWAERTGMTLVAFKVPGAHTLSGGSKENTEPSSGSTAGGGGEEDNEPVSSLRNDVAEGQPAKSLRRVLFDFESLGRSDEERAQ
jgi:hypothetical protein